MGTIVVDDGMSIYVKPPESEGSEEDGPDLVTDLFETDVEATEKLGDVDPLGVPPYPAVGRDFAEFEVSGVLEGRDLVGEGTR
jgi:hypothetical protein